MSEANKDLVREFHDKAINAHDVDALATFVADDLIDHNAMPDMPSGLEGMAAMMSAFFTGFSDVRSEVQDLIAKGDRVAVRVRTTGTHDGEFMGNAPTGKTFEIDEIHIVRIEGGKMVEHWGLEDSVAMMGQLGISPPG